MHYMRRHDVRNDSHRSRHRRSQGLGEKSLGKRPFVVKRCHDGVTGVSLVTVKHQGWYTEKDTSTGAVVCPVVVACRCLSCCVATAALGEVSMFGRWMKTVRVFRSFHVTCRFTEKRSFFHTGRFMSFQRWPEVWKRRGSRGSTAAEPASSRCGPPRWSLTGSACISESQRSPSNCPRPQRGPVVFLGFASAFDTSSSFFF